MVAELIIGPQAPATKAAFSMLRTAREKSAFSGWKMDGWVRWIEGLRGMYERRMVRMCRILDSGSAQLKTSTPVRLADADWGVITKTQLLTYAWPRGGMFVWLRINLDKHPLFQAAGSAGQLIDGTVLSSALFIFLTKKPHLVIISPGAIFSATPEIRTEEGWPYFRLCFAAETEENVDAASQRFVDGLHAFWQVKDVKLIEELLKDWPIMTTGAQGGLDDGYDLGMSGLTLGC
jgi:DNA-binding transcriptional MocR family regulator